jgi:small-conductance mechanosensitive channel
VRKIPLDPSSANTAFVAGHRDRESRSAAPRLAHILIELLLLLLLPGLLIALLATLSRLLLLLTRLLVLLAALALLATLVWIAHVFPRLVSVYASSQSLAERAGSIWEELSTPIRSVRPSWNTDCKGRRVGYPGSPPQKWMTA